MLRKRPDRCTNNVEANYSIAPPVDSVGLSRSRLLLTSVFALYREKFPRWFAYRAYLPIGCRSSLGGEPEDKGTLCRHPDS